MAFCSTLRCWSVALVAQSLYTNSKGVEVEADMTFRNGTLYWKLRASIEDACQDSLSWRPHTTKYQNLIQSILAEQIVRKNIEWWAPHAPIADEAALWLDLFFAGYQEERAIADDAAQLFDFFFNSYQKKTENGLIWDINAFDRAYSRLEAFLYQETYISHYVSPLHLFRCDSPTPVELEKGVCIREPDELLWRYLMASQEFRSPEHSLGFKGWVVDIVIDQPKSAKRESKDSDIIKARKKAHRVLQSLRLLHKGEVFTGPVYYLIHPEFAPFKQNVGVLHDTDLTTLPLLPLAHPSYFRPSDYYQLPAQEVEELKTIYALIPEEFSSYPALGLSLGRFGNYFRRSSELDGLLDLVIALEALFGEGSQGITYKLALRCSYFLEPKFEERRQAFDKLKCIYNIRSSIAHGMPDLSRELRKEVRKLWGEDDVKAFASAVDDAAEYVRRAIRNVIVEGHLDKFRVNKSRDLTPWHKFLDDLVLRGSA